MLPPTKRIPFSAAEKNFCHVLKIAIDEHGRRPPPAFKLPTSVALVVGWDEFVLIYDAYTAPRSDESEEQWHRALRQRTGNSLAYSRETIGIKKDDHGKYWLWFKSIPMEETDACC